MAQIDRIRTQLLVNVSTPESATLALAAGAGGVHLAGKPQAGAASRVRQAFRDAIISVPCHNLEDIRLATQEQVNLSSSSRLREDFRPSLGPGPRRASRGLCCCTRHPRLRLWRGDRRQRTSLCCRRRRRNCRHSTLRGRRLAPPLEPASHVYGTIYSGIRLTMQSVRLKKSLAFPRSAWSRQYSYFLSALLMAMGMLSGAVPCQAQDTTKTMPAAPVSQEKYDAGVSGFYQVTNAANGNFIRDDTTESGGALISLRRPWRPWAGYAVDLGFTKFYEAYNKGVVKVESNVTDLSFSYLFQSPTFYGMQAYLSLGGGIIVFSPISGTLTDLNSPTTKSLPSQLVPEFAYNFGLNYPIIQAPGGTGRAARFKIQNAGFSSAIDRYQDATNNPGTKPGRLLPLLSRRMLWPY